MVNKKLSCALNDTAIVRPVTSEEPSFTKSAIPDSTIDAHEDQREPGGEWDLEDEEVG